MSDYSIGNELKDSYKETYNWCSYNIKWLRDVQNFYKQRANLEKEYSEKLNQLTNDFLKKKAESSVPLSVGDSPVITPGSAESGTVMCWTEILTETQMIGKDHSQLSEELQFQVVDQIDALIKKSNSMLSGINGFVSELDSRKYEIYHGLDKAKKNYDYSCEDLENIRSKIANGNNSVRLKEKLQSKENEMNNCKNDYLIQVNLANRTKDKYYFQDLPESLDLLQNLVQYKTLQLNNLNNIATNLQRSMDLRIGKKLDLMESTINSTTPDLDIKMFIKHNKKQWSEPKDFQYIASPIWHEDASFVVKDDANLTHLKNRLALSQSKEHQMDEVMTTEIDSLSELKQNTLSNSVIMSGIEPENLLKSMTEYVRTLASFTNHESNKLEATVCIESIVNNLGSKYDLDTSGIDVSSLNKKSGGILNKFKNTLKLETPKRMLYSSSSDSGVSEVLHSSGGGESAVGGLLSGLTRKNHHSSKLGGLFGSGIRSRSNTIRSTTSSRANVPVNNRISSIDSNTLSSEESEYDNNLDDSDDDNEYATNDTNPVKVKVLYSYEKTDDSELTINTGDSLSLIAPDTNGWTQVKNDSTGEIGLVPTSYVEVSKSSATTAPQLPGKRKNNLNDDNGGTTVTALYSYEAQGNDELSITAGDSVKVVHKDDGSGWTLGELNGSTGLFPTSYCS
ncbi:related to Protein BZZ1 [Saccharomycodes ludwigii]|uniref:Protein BZZ1 n=1 Tax=Saccharomycodes ludwigii TaxID=36035 RepID=A0A376BBR6_9ASCO|nr:hypothetical protein SCDLUD_002893 [Saccharomycodes ludwigii]KAH3901401.1 hypothetical protein SCDLUD_002893 [Saccharomycodes ludwigii]SSD62138.1 related to Protein BZZ1 [Saccharomycodes ludwigii]